MEEQKLYDIIISRELTWEGLIRDIVTNEGLDPWNIDISILANIFVKSIREMKNRDIVLSGKFILAAAILLKMKADYLLIKEEEEKAAAEESVESLLPEKFKFEIEPHLPLPKQRKVTLDELLSSLRKALVVKKRRDIKMEERKVEIKREIRKVDIGQKIKNLYEQVTNFFKNLKIPELKFSQLISSNHRWDIIWTFIPLIHLANKGKISLRQEEPFGEIYVRRGEETESSS